MEFPRHTFGLATDSPTLVNGLIAQTTEHTNPGVYETLSNGRVGPLLVRTTLVALAVRLITIGFVYRGFLDPGRDHWEFGYEAGKVAASIVTGHGFGNLYVGTATGPTAMLAPAFPYLMAAVMAVFGLYTKAAALAILAINSVFSALTCVPIFFIARKSFGFQVARWAAWSWVFLPYAIYFSAASMWNHALSALILSLLFLAALYLQESTSLRSWAMFGILWGIGGLVMPVILGTFPFLAGWACFRLYLKKQRWAMQAVAAVIAVLVTISPWLIRNYRVFHHPVFFHGFPLVFTVSNVGNTVHWWNPAGDPPGNAAEMAEFQRVGEHAYMDEKWRVMFAFVKAHPGIVVWRSIRRFVYMWTGYWSFRPEYLREEMFDPLNIPLCTASSLLALVGLRKGFRTSAATALPYAVVLLVFPAVYYITSSTMAYRHVLDPEIVILGSSAVVPWLLARRSARWGHDHAIPIECPVLSGQTTDA